MINKPDKNEIRRRKHVRVRKKIAGTPARPRLCVFRSNLQMYAQIIDDTNGQTIAAASTLDKDIKLNTSVGANKEGARAVGELVAKRAIEKGVKEVVFDRSGYIYHGRVAALAEAAREAGLTF
ncbi:MAG: 50S ribosomal protein L18 [Clostridiaceae bacterium]|jgi:large subunit ribosomal protein L18|nr:50S ribosomal protein L18 [Oscillospiraceae bacterium]NLO62283.1 50S ribosomal protein L18 [Clostridiaceae bacterium]